MKTGSLIKPIVDFLSPSDKELFEHQFETEVDSLLDGLIETAPHTNEIPIIESEYDATPKGGRSAGAAPHLKCLFNHPQRHWKGIVVRYKNNSRARVGRNCAAEHFGVKFNEQLKTFDAARSRKAQLQELLKIIELLPAALKELGAAKESKSVAEFDSCRQAFAGGFGKLVPILRGVQMHNAGTLVSHKSVRDHAAEDRIADSSDEGKQHQKDVESARRKGQGVLKAAMHRQRKWRQRQPQQWKKEETVIGVIAGGKVFIEQRQLYRVISTVHLRLAGHLKTLLNSTSDEWSDLRTADAISAVRGLVAQGLEAERQIARLNQFATEENLRTISRWTIADADAERSRYGEKLFANGLTLDNRSPYAKWRSHITFRWIEPIRLVELQKLAAALRVT